MSKKRVQFCELYSKNQFLETFFTFQNILCVIFFFLQKSSIQWVIIFEKFRILSIILKKGSILWVIFKKKVQFIETYWKKSSILRVIFDKIRSQFFESYSRNPVQFFFESIKKIQFFESCWKTRKVHFFASYWKEVFVSVGEKKGSILWVFFASKKIRFFESYSKRDSILWIILKKRFNSMSHKKEFNSMSHNSKKRGSILWAMQKKKVQFFESY